MRGVSKEAAPLDEACGVGERQDLGYQRFSDRARLVHNAAAVYDAKRIRQRARVIGYAIDARRRRFSG